MLTPKFDADGLITCVVADATSGEALMVAPEVVYSPTVSLPSFATYRLVPQIAIRWANSRTALAIIGTKLH